MTQNLASAPARAWNQKNLPSYVEWMEERSEPSRERLGQIAGAAAEFAQRRRGLLVLSLLALGAVGLLWFYSRAD